MNDADMAAMPTQSNGGDIFGGLTKREMMAATLPEMEMRVSQESACELLGRQVDWNDALDEIRAAAAIEAIQRAIRAGALLAELGRTCHKT
jgi:hypothetical protein